MPYNGGTISTLSIDHSMIPVLSCFLVYHKKRPWQKFSKFSFRKKKKKTDTGFQRTLNKFEGALHVIVFL